MSDAEEEGGDPGAVKVTSPHPQPKTNPKPQTVSARAPRSGVRTPGFDVALVKKDITFIFLKVLHLLILYTSPTSTVPTAAATLHALPRVVAKSM